MSVRKSILGSLLICLTFFVFYSGVAAVEIGDFISADDLNKLRDITTIRTVGTIEMGGMIGRMEMIYEAPDKVWMLSDFGFLQISQMYDGHTAWMKDQNGQTIELTGTEKQNFINAAYLSGSSFFLPDRMSSEIEYQGDTLTGDSAYSVFVAIPANGDSLRLFFSKTTKQLEIVGEKLDEVSIYTYMSDFKMVDGVEMPYISDSKASVPQLNSIIKLDSIEVNIPVDDSIFSAVEEGESDLLFPVGVDSVVVPMFYYNDHIFIEVSVNGNKKVYFILDSGSGANLLDSSYAAQLGLEQLGGVPAKGVTGYESVAFAKIDSLSIGDIKLRGGLAAVANIGGMSLRLPGELGGLIGYDLLARLPFEINYKDSELVFYNPKKFTPPDSTYAVDFELIMKAPLVTAKYGGYEGKFLIDLGNPFGLMLHRAFVEKYNLKKTFSDIKDMAGQIGGIGGKSEAYAAVGANLQIGRAEIKSPPVVVVETGQGITESTTIDGNLGNQLLSRFTILMDYNKKKIYILPR
jgi:hypothetical protein